jgi:2-methylcitrate dehydratase PrpD
VDFSAFAAEARADLAGLRARVELRLAEPYAAAYPEAWGGAVTIITKDGNILSERRNHARGDPEAPLGREEIIAKAAMLMAYGGVRDSGRLINAILALVDDGSLPSLALVDSGEY